jgi:hypothetical protein
MEISKREEITTSTTQSIEVGEFLICLQITKTQGQTKYVSLSRTGKGETPLIPNILYLYSMEEAQAALELLKAIMGNEANA